MVTWPNPGSPAFVTSQMEEAETNPINPQITIFEWKGRAFPDL